MDSMLRGGQQGDSHTIVCRNAVIHTFRLPGFALGSKDGIYLFFWKVEVMFCHIQGQKRPRSRHREVEDVESPEDGTMNSMRTRRVHR